MKKPKIKFSKDKFWARGIAAASLIASGMQMIEFFSIWIAIFPTLLCGWAAITLLSEFDEME